MPNHAKTLPEHSHAIPSKTQRAPLAIPDRGQPLAPGAILQRAALAPQSLRPADILRLQQTHGNRFVQRLLESSVLQRDCSCGGTCPACSSERLESSPVPSVVNEVLRSPGQPLDASTRASMEPRFGRDFGGVRIHNSAKASESAKAVGALAYTVGQDIVFAEGRYDPVTQAGQRLLAHELAHTVQQTGAGPGPISGISQPGDASEREAERVADSVMRKEEPASARASFNIGEERSEDDDEEEERTLLSSPAKKEAVIPGDDEDKLKTEDGAGRITSAPVLARAIDWAEAKYTSDNNNAASTCVEEAFDTIYFVTPHPLEGLWRMAVFSIKGGVNIKVHTGGSRDPSTTPPTTEAEAKQAVKDMKGYYRRGTRGSWHTEEASKVHEKHHEREWKCAAEHYWPDAEKAINKLTTPMAGSADAATAKNAMKPDADNEVASFRKAAKSYWMTLGDAKGDRPYAAGQAVLNGEVTKVQQLAATNKWTVKAGTTNTSGTEPPCYNSFALVDFGRFLHII